MNLLITLGKLMTSGISQLKSSPQENSVILRNFEIIPQAWPRLGRKQMSGFLSGTLKKQQLIINDVGETKTMLEKLLLAATITFSLNLFFQVPIPNESLVIVTNKTDKNQQLF
ncbi:hypothetical protein [Cylindrospermum sp. FACHB-282]|uniref:hypothetical protein n=1 Tax=Cylindrospermum sp. FACHB-282 TaxID=2692794 RepID=UPI0016860E84|nr:hypothetical protein [Cylindrospermum sp. FACHB-282]MBD2386528.1 hypothetical protein [Cylindrospermum sp. FACHB-282]